MEYRYSKKIQKLTNDFFGKADNRNIDVQWQNLDAFNILSEAVLHNEGDTELIRFETGFDLGVKYAQERIDAKLNGKPLPDLWMTCAPHTNHFFIGTEDKILEHIREAAAKLELDTCICDAKTLFSVGCQC